MLSSGKTVRWGPAASARRAIAVAAGKGVRAGVRRQGTGIGTRIPGRISLAIDPGALAGLVAEIGRGSVLVTGSNGKGTTCRMLAEVMRAAGWNPLLNADGANQRSGLATTLVARAGLSGHLPGDAQAVGLFEVDEGSFPEIVRHVPAPIAIVCTNIFRDQLNRYCEPAYIKALLDRAVRRLPATTTLVLNADDPRVASLAAELPNPRLYFGMSDLAPGRSAADPSADYPRCPRCEGELAYSRVFYAHLGHWACSSCGLSRPKPDVTAAKIDLIGATSTRIHISTATADTVLDVPMPGLYNAYNALAAASAATACNLPDSSLGALEGVTAGPFRMERIQVTGHDVYLALAKNANGYTEVLRAILGDGEPRRMLLGLNDCPGKQPDTSWIWDVDFDALNGLVPAPVVTGNRAADLAVRLRYADWLGDELDQASDVIIEPDPVRAFQAAIVATPAAEPLWIVSTSIALWEIRRWLRRHGHVRALEREQHRAGPPTSAPPSSAPPSSAPLPPGPQPSAPPLSGRRPPSPGRRRSARRPAAPKGAAR